MRASCTPTQLCTRLAHTIADDLIAQSKALRVHPALPAAAMAADKATCLLVATCYTCCVIVILIIIIIIVFIGIIIILVAIRILLTSS